MTDNDDVSDTTDDTSAPVTTDATAPGPILKTRWRDRAWSFRAMLAVALATLLIGGVAGGTVVGLTSDDGDHGRLRLGPERRVERVPPEWRGPGEFRDGSPRWRWNEGPPPPDGDTTPDGQPSQPTPSQ